MEAYRINGRIYRYDPEHAPEGAEPVRPKEPKKAEPKKAKKKAKKAENKAMEPETKE